jgi:predicted membrane protein
MEKKNTRHNLFRITLALLFMCFGIIALGNNIGWWNIDDLFLTWWPLILILLGFITIFAPGGSWGGGVFLVVLGIILLLHTHGVYDIGRLIWPAMLIMVGVIIWPRKKDERGDDDISSGVSAEILPEHVFNYNVLFHGKRKSINDKQLGGGHGTAVFGSLVLDLRQAVPKSGAYIELNAVFGSVRIAVPPHWNVTKNGGAVFGKVTDRRKQLSESAYSYPVTIETNAVFGHIELSD